MELHKAIPDGFMTVGELAGKMGVTVRALQHYDKNGLLHPSAISEGGRRLYTDQDMIRLHQILSLKHLGFSLHDIQARLTPLDTPEEVAALLSEQAESIRAQLRCLTDSLRDIEALRDEVLQMQTVDFKKYADIIVNLQMGNEYYWLIKYFDDDMLDHIRARFDQKSGIAFMQRFLALQNKAIALHRAGTAPDGDEGQAFAAEYWSMVTEFTGGDPTVLARLTALGQAEGPDPAWQENQALANAFVAPALDAYFARLGTLSFGEVPQ